MSFCVRPGRPASQLWRCSTAFPTSGDSAPNIVRLSGKIQVRPCAGAERHWRGDDWLGPGTNLSAQRRRPRFLCMARRSANVQVFGRRNEETDDALKRPATKKRQGTKSGQAQKLQRLL